MTHAISNETAKPADVKAKKKLTASPQMSTSDQLRPIDPTCV